MTLLIRLSKKHNCNVAFIDVISKVFISTVLVYLIVPARVQFSLVYDQVKKNLLQLKTFFLLS